MKTNYYIIIYYQPMNTFACMTSYFQALQVITITFNTTLAINMKSKVLAIANITNKNGMG